MKRLESLWIRLGGYVIADADTIQKIVNGDSQALLKAVNNGQFTVEGESYIPDNIIEEYNIAHDKDVDEIEEVTFYL